MGLFRRKDERAIPKPGTPEFDQAVEGTALPDDQSVSMGESGWTKPESEPTPDESAADQPAGDEATPDGTAPEAEQPDQPEEKQKRRDRIIRGMAQRVPNQGGFGAGVPGPKKPKK